jgi:hypothetical protein
MWGLPNTPRAVRLVVPKIATTWPIVVDPVDEPDGGTFYRPEPPTWINGTAAPSATAGDEDDCFLDTTHHQWYGPKGAEDPDTHEGNWPGPYDLPDPGTGEWVNGSGEPDDLTDGANGDYYLDTTAHAWYGPKANDTWAGSGPHYIREAWVLLAPPLFATGLFSFPDCTLRQGRTGESAQTADVWVEFADANGMRIGAAVHLAKLVSAGGLAQRGAISDLLLELKISGTAAKLRFKIVGGYGLYWSLSGSMERLL